MRVPSLLSLAPIGAAAILACGKQTAGADASSATAQPPGAAAVPSRPGGGGDTTRAQLATGVPAGYVIRTDDPSASPADAKYTTVAGGSAWDVETGPAHILYRPGDTASGSYTLHTQIDQLAAPHHPEAYGVFLGGRDLTGAGQRYTYFIVRGNGEYAIKARDGAAASTIVDFTASPNVPTANTSGRATYAITVRVAPDSTHFLVNEKPVAAIPTSRVGAGIVGIRINHHLHVGVTPLVITR